VAAFEENKTGATTKVVKIGVEQNQKIK